MADSAIVKAVQDYLVAVRQAGLHARRAVLFGSHARGDANADSDIDVLVSFAKLLKTNYTSKVIIEASCDSRGTNEYNKSLSLKRARSVYQILVNTRTGLQD